MWTEEPRASSGRIGKCEDWEMLSVWNDLAVGIVQRLELFSGWNCLAFGIAQGLE